MAHCLFNYQVFLFFVLDLFAILFRLTGLFLSLKFSAKSLGFSLDVTFSFIAFESRMSCLTSRGLNLPLSLFFSIQANQKLILETKKKQRQTYALS